MNDALWWFLFNLLSIIMLAFYSMLEMACVSFNRVRLHYYVSKGNKRAIWLNELLHNPSMLFGTTLIGVNVAMIFGSEFAREFHSAIGLNPNLAPLSQVLIVVIIGELAPMFAARGYPEHVAMLGVPLVYASAKIMAPILWVLGLITKFCNWIFRGKEAAANIYLTQEELQKILEEQEEGQPFASDREQFNAITANIFSLRQMDARSMMTPLRHVPLIASNATIDQARQIFQDKDVDYLPVYHNELDNIIGIAFPRDLIRAADSRRVRDHARTPWFVTENAKLTHILKQFRRNNQEVAIILNHQGYAVGIINLEDMIEQIFTKASYPSIQKRISKPKKMLIIDRTFPGELKVGDFNAQFDVSLTEHKDLTLSELMTQLLGHTPEEGESVYIDPFELTVKEAGLREVKTIYIKTKLK